MFPRCFVDTLRDHRDVMEGTKLFMRLKRPVIENARQTPEYGNISYPGHYGGDFLFVSR